MKNKAMFILLKKRHIYIILFVLLISLAACALIVSKSVNNSSPAWTKNKSLKYLLFNNNKFSGKVSIIIDDFGNHGEGTNEMLTNIQRPLTCAIMPFMPYTKEEAELAHKLGHEVIIHIPMEPHIGNPSWLGEKGITTLLPTEDIIRIVTEAIEEVPHAVGVNNHMGSKATENRRVVEAIIKVLKEKNMYIVDSRTSPNSVIREIAEEFGVKVFERDVFLDNSKDVYNIKKQIKELELVAERKKIAIGIGHVGPEGGSVTAKAIQEMIPEIESMGLEIVTVSNLID